MENEAFAPKEQMLHFPCFQICDISKASKGVIREERVIKAIQFNRLTVLNTQKQISIFLEIYKLACLRQVPA